MKISKWLASAETKLAAVGIGSSRLDSLILLEDELGKDRSLLLASQEIELTKLQQKSLSTKLKRRLKHEPMAYIRGFSEFYGRNFFINKDVLEPRPESETMIELLFKQNLRDGMKIVDVGTGSGAIAITVKLEKPELEVLATEIDEEALAIAKQNAKTHKATVRFSLGNLLEPVMQPMDIILANLPYVPDSWQINEAAAMEPRVAIFGGSDGLELYRKMFNQIRSLGWTPSFIFTESLPPQHGKLSSIAKKSGYVKVDSKDFIQVFSPTD